MTRVREARTPSPVTYTALERPNMSIPRVGAIGADQNSAPDQVNVGFQKPVCNRKMVTHYQIQNAFATALLDQLKRFRCQCYRTLQGVWGLGNTLQYPRLRINPPHFKFKYNSVLELYLLSKCLLTTPIILNNWTLYIIICNPILAMVNMLVNKNLLYVKNMLEENIIWEIC